MRSCLTLPHVLPLHDHYRTLQVGVIKRQLQLSMPSNMSIFLDVDDMKDVGLLEEYIKQSMVILMFVSKGYFSSRNCQREIKQTCESDKPIVLVHEADLRCDSPLTHAQAEETLPSSMQAVHCCHD